MNNIVFTLVGGILVIAISFLLLYRFSRLQGKFSAVVMALLVLLVYLPYAISNWPGADIFSIHIAIYLMLVYILGIVTSQRDAKKRAGEDPGIGIHWAPATIVVFFLFIFIADSLFVMFATKGMNYDVARWLLPKPQSGAKVSSNFPGTVKNNFHEKGEQFNVHVNRAKQQAERGWQVNKGWLGEVKVGQLSMFRVTVKDKEGLPVEKAEVSGIFMRPGNMNIDQRFTMQEKAPGDYFVQLTLTEQGMWNLALKINHPQGVHELTAITTVSGAVNHK